MEGVVHFLERHKVFLYKYMTACLFEDHTAQNGYGIDFTEERFILESHVLSTSGVDPVTCSTSSNRKNQFFLLVQGMAM